MPITNISFSWQYHTEDELAGTSIRGELQTYGGGGYTQLLGNTSTAAKETLQMLRVRVILQFVMLCLDWQPCCRFVSGYQLYLSLVISSFALLFFFSLANISVVRIFFDIICIKKNEKSQYEMNILQATKIVQSLGPYENMKYNFNTYTTSYAMTLAIMQVHLA